MQVRIDSQKDDDISNILTKGEAVGLSRIASSSSVKGNFGTSKVLTGAKSRITTGNPMAPAERETTIVHKQWVRFIIIRTFSLGNSHCCGKSY